MTKVLAGLDAGASKCLALLCDGDGRILAREKGPGLALDGPPGPAQAAGFKALMDSLLKQAGVAFADLDQIGLGVHGVDFEDELAAQKQALAAVLGLAPAKLTVVNDGIVALWGASPAPRSAILQHGSGVTGAYRSALGQEQCFDHLNVGGLFDLRWEALKAARRMLDGRLPITPLLGQIEGLLGVQGKRAFSDARYREQLPKAAVARLGSVVFTAWGEGDSTAASLVQRAVEDYACSALAMARLSGASELYFGGGVIDHAPAAFWDLLRAQVQASLPAAVIAAPQMGPDKGACLLAGFQAGLNVQDLWDRLPH